MCFLTTVRKANRERNKRDELYTLLVDIEDHLINNGTWAAVADEHSERKQLLARIRDTIGAL